MINVIALFIVLIVTKSDPKVIFKGGKKFSQDIMNCCELTAYSELGIDLRSVNCTLLKKIKDVYNIFLESRMLFSCMSKYAINEKINLVDMSFNLYLTTSVILCMVFDMIQFLAYGSLQFYNFLFSLAASSISALAIALLKLMQTKIEIESDIQDDMLILLSEVSLRLGSGYSLANALAESTDSLENTYFALLIKHEVSDVRSGRSIEDSILEMRSKTNSIICDKFIQIMINGFEFGDSRLKDRINALCDEIWTMRFMNIKDHMERLKVKMVLPTMINFAAIMMMVIIPIILNLGGMFSEK